MQTPSGGKKRNTRKVGKKFYFSFVIGFLIMILVLFFNGNEESHLKLGDVFPFRNTTYTPSNPNQIIPTNQYSNSPTKAKNINDPIEFYSNHVYFVSLHGNDKNKGTFEHPWKTINFGVSNLEPGDVLFIRGGIYQEVIKIKNSGIENQTITITNYGNEEVVIDGNRNTIPNIAGTPLISITGDWVVVKGINVAYSGELGIFSNGKNVTLDNVYVHHSRGTGVLLAGDYNLIQNSRIWYNSIMNEFGKSSTWGSGVSCARYPDYCTIRNTVAWENWGEGISTFEALHTRIEGNTSFDNQQNYYISDTKYSVLAGNLSYCTPDNYIDTYETQNGILVGDEKGVPIPLQENSTRFTSSDNRIINNIVIGCNRNLAAGPDQSNNNIYANNTFVNASGNTSERFNVLFYRGSAHDARFINNIIYQEDETKIAISSGSGIEFANNLWSKKPPMNLLSKNDIIGNPRFLMIGEVTNPNWYVLIKNSPAINNGTPLSDVEFDFFGNPRDSKPDIGAIEFLLIN